MEHFENVKSALANWTDVMARQVPRLADAVRQAQVIWICGNGGSEALAEHWATDWTKALWDDNPKPIVAYAANASLTTMIANDFGAGPLFRIPATAPGLTIAISTSGRSPNLTQWRWQWVICPASSHLGLQGSERISGAPYTPGVLEDVYSLLGHAVAEELRRV